jgi:DNA modification methylase
MSTQRVEAEKGPQLWPLPVKGNHRPDEYDQRCLLTKGATPQTVARKLAALDWSFADAASDELTHQLHPYPAKFIGSLPRQVIQALSVPGDLVADVFSGGGTSAVEAVVAGRRAFSIDANRVGNLIGRAKTTPISKRDLSALQHLEADLVGMQRRDLQDANPHWLPEIPNRAKWYGDDVFRALGLVRAMVVSKTSGKAQALALVAFVHAASRLSYQESETRYTSKPRPIDVLDVPRAVLSELRRVRRTIQRLPNIALEATFVDGDSRDPVSYADVAPESVGLIVTSPPYPNAYDYHLYHRFRLFWLGADPKELRRTEIGSHLKNQSLTDATGEYLRDMKAVFENCLSVLGRGRWMVVIVGDGLFGGKVFETARELTVVGEQLGFETFGVIERPLPADRRSVTKPGRRLTSEHVLLFRRPVGDRSALVIDPNYRLFPYERDLQERELRALGASPQRRKDGATYAVPTAALARAAFVHGWAHAGSEESSPQRLLEGEQPGRRKNSTYVTHGVHRYKGKFYPQLAKALLNLSGLEPGESLVMDPFGGSGTVLLEAVLNGYDAVSVDSNPLAVAIAEAKTAMVEVNPETAKASFERVTSRLAAANVTPSATFEQMAADTLPELERWFPTPVLSKLDVLLSVVRSEPKELVGFYEVLVSDIIREVSQQEPKDLRIRRRSVPIEDAPVIEPFGQRLAALRGRLEAYWELPRSVMGAVGSASAVLGSSANPKTFDALNGRVIDAVVSSPPYAAALPYLDTDRLSLAAVLGVCTASRRRLETIMIGSREITESERRLRSQSLAAGTTDGLPPSTLDFLTSYQAAVDADGSAGFRRKQAPAVLLRYFSAMSAVMRNLRERMAPGTPCWFVLGDSRSTIGGRRWVIPTVDEIASIAGHVGFQVVERIPITVTREDVLHSRHAITQNVVLRFSA